MRVDNDSVVPGDIARSYNYDPEDSRWQYWTDEKILKFDGCLGLTWDQPTEFDHDSLCTIDKYEVIRREPENTFRPMTIYDQT